MKNIILAAVIILMAHSSLAQQKASEKDNEPKEEHVQMHEQMAKAHQQAAECLKAGESEDECRSEFQKMCIKAGGSERCGVRMHKRMKNSAK